MGAAGFAGRVCPTTGGICGVPSSMSPAAEIERGLPASPEAERAVLGAILLDNAAYPEVASSLRPDDFSLDSHRRIFLRMVELGESGKPIDAVTLTGELGRHREIEAVGGVAYLSQLTDGIPRRANCEHHVRMIRDKAAGREFIQACSGAIAEAMEQSSPATECIAKLGDRLLDIPADQKQEGPIALRDVTMPTLDNVLALRKRRDGLIGLSYGIPCLDRATTGIREHEFIVIGGRPGQGKTAESVQIAAACGRAKIPVGVFSLEMTREQWNHRLWAHAGKFPFWKLRDPRRMNDDDEQRLMGIAAETSEWPIYLDDQGSLSPAQISARARLLVKRHGVRLIIVDYLQLVGGAGGNLRERVSDVSHRLRAIAKELVPVVALSQLRRPQEGSESEPPSLYELKESGDIEADAHAVLLVFRPKKDGSFTGEDEIIVAKQRSGPVGAYAVHFNDDTLDFHDRSVEGYEGYDSKAAQAGGE